MAVTERYTYGVGYHGGKDCAVQISYVFSTKEVAAILTWSLGIVGVELAGQDGNGGHLE
jgi:hypothetical protein